MFRADRATHQAPPDAVTLVKRLRAEGYSRMYTQNEE
jgi:hypothetical protein